MNVAADGAFQAAIHRGAADVITDFPREQSLLAGEDKIAADGTFLIAFQALSAC